MTSKLRALIVEDNVEMRTKIESYFRQHQIDATSVGDLPSARMLLSKHEFEVIILDLILGEEDGMTLARENVRQGGPPVIVVSARVEEADRVMALELGADDYLPKPFSFRELLARTRAVCRRPHLRDLPELRSQLLFGSWRLDLAARTLIRADDSVVELTSGEYDLLRAFPDNPHRVLSRSQLLTITGHNDAEVFERTIDVLINRLRHKLEEDSHRPHIIQTVRGVGYRLSLNVKTNEPNN